MDYDWKGIQAMGMGKIQIDVKELGPFKRGLRSVPCQMDAFYPYSISRMTIEDFQRGTLGSVQNRALVLRSLARRTGSSEI